MKSCTQFLLTNGDEIIAEVMDEPEDDGDVNIVLRNAMKLFTKTEEEGYRYYSFRPWMVYQDHQEFLTLLNYSHIVGEAKPSPVLLAQWEAAISVINVEARDREDELADLLAAVIERDSDQPPSSKVINIFDKLNKKDMH